ncbi:MAG: hypothetical protein GX594_16405 [Pirellulaceae bacterium]|nr:hypothetical protein [Pirellulaceae bacterium]
MNTINRLIIATNIVSVTLLAASTSNAAAPIDISSPQIVHSKEAGQMEELAARELWRYLARVSGKPGTIMTDDAASPDRAAIVLLDVAGNNKLAAEIEKQEKIAVDVAALGDEGFRWKVVECRGKPALLLTAAKPVGVLYGTYALLEKIGVGFYLGGDTFPPAGSSLTVDASLDETHKPVFAIRGALPWGNLLNAAWDPDDLRQYYEQLAKQRFNFVGFHQYDIEPWCAYPWQGNLIGGNPLRTSSDKYFMTVRRLPTAQFGWGISDYYDRDPFTSRGRLEGKNREDQIRRSISLLADSMGHAHRLGLKVCLGFELFGDPTVPGVADHLEARIVAVLKNYPLLDYIWFFQNEEASRKGWDVPKGSEVERLIREEGETFAYLGNPKRIAEAVRFSYHFNMAYRIVKKHRPDLPIAINGWGGDRWLLFTDLFVGLDKTLPNDVIFASQDNIDPSIEPTVSKAYSRVSPQRVCWPIPWWNSDGGGSRGDMWAPQCNVKPFVPLCRDVLAKRCQGMIGVHWCTRDVEEVAGYQARFAWNPTLTYEEFYDDMAKRCFGARWGKTTGKILRDLDSLGPRWTGSRGQPTELGFSLSKFGYPPPKKENLQKLADIRRQLTDIRREMLADRQLEGLERIEWFLTTIDWVTRFDDAVVRLHVTGPVEKLLREAETAHAAGNAGLAKQKAQAAWEEMQKCGLKEALQTYPRKMSTIGEFGSMASIQTKVYASYLDLRDRVQKILGPLGDDLAGPPVPPGTPPFMVGRQPKSLLESGRELSVSAVVIGSEPITSCVLRYRPIGADAWKDVPMTNTFRRTYAAEIPAADVTLEARGIEWFVEARDQAGRAAHWPKGYPSVVWSATIVPSQPRE